MKSNTIIYTSFTLVFMIALCQPVIAQSFDYEDIYISISPEADSYQPGSEGIFLVTIDIPDGYEIACDPGMLTASQISEDTGITLQELELTEADIVTDLGGHYIGIKELRLPFAVDDKAGAGSMTIEIGFVMQACEMDGMCYMPSKPEDTAVEVSLTIK